MRKLTIVLGAGASLSCVDDRDAIPNNEWKPPLAAALFNTRMRNYGSILEKYDGARALSSRIRSRTRQGQHFEDVLRSIAQSDVQDVRIQFLQIALYLQELLGEVTDQYVDQGTTKYTDLVIDVDEWIQNHQAECLFVTLNYDFFLDRELENYYGTNFSNMDQYVQVGRPWNLVKIHGCVKWSHIIKPQGPRTKSWPEIIRKHLNQFPLQGQPIVMSKWNDEARFSSGTEYKYPALAVPLGGLKDFVCPDKHVDFARDFIRDCKEFLVIGMSGLDQSILSLLALAEQVDRVMIANGSTKASEEAHMKIGKAAPNFFLDISKRSQFKAYDGGLRELVDADELRRVLEAI